MKWFNYSNHQHLSDRAAGIIMNAINASQNSFIGIATGFSPNLTYRLVGEKLSHQRELVKRINILQLDEWYGLSPENPASCHDYIQKVIINEWGLSKEQCLMIKGNHPEQTFQLQSLKSSLDNRKMDLCILGIGKNGHLALNEPGSRAGDPLRVVELAESSQSHQMLSQNQVVVDRGITIGLKEILESRQILLLITGTGKKKAYLRLRTGEVLLDFPASVLHVHNNVHCLVDKSVVY